MFAVLPPTTDAILANDHGEYKSGAGRGKNAVPLPTTMPQAGSPVSAADSVCVDRLGGCLPQGQRRGA